MKICFVLPKFARKPVGGFKMTFEYANRLYEKGYEVKILFLNDVTFKKYPIPQFVKDIASNYLTRKEPTWFPLNPQIEKISGTKANFQSKVENADVVIATAVETVQYVKSLFPNKKKVYFIQGYETWAMPENDVRKTYQRGFTNIVVAEWLKKIVDDEAGTPSILIKNPVDIGIYRCSIPLRKRRKYSIAFLYHENECKGTVYALKTIEKLKKMYPDLDVNSFGTVKKPIGLLEGTKYTYCASQAQTVEIYNKSEVFLCTTIEEGYGLTGLEAMACGAALVSTDYQGVHEYATNGVNALLSPVKDVDALVSNVSKLFDNDELRYQIAEAGIKSVQKDFNWDIAVDKFEKAITE